MRRIMSIKEARRVRYSPAGSYFGIFSFFTLRIMDLSSSSDHCSGPFHSSCSAQSHKPLRISCSRRLLPVSSLDHRADQPLFMFTCACVHFIRQAVTVPEMIVHQFRRCQAVEGSLLSASLDLLSSGFMNISVIFGIV